MLQQEFLKTKLPGGISTTTPTSLEHSWPKNKWHFWTGATRHQRFPRASLEERRATFQGEQEKLKDEAGRSTETDAAGKTLCRPEAWRT